ncbi:HEAT repeat-containing protein 1 isoform X1 [Hemibagrus wyckioides]|uniref:HEAT repeat-containing protein 1 isoform X1 n=1 Tax=Hemibagrus wyckioides TaxID=337641 RepID=UPI00266D5EF9|nr:HEAT repeat-containing protein 1 isoform X1 [Hemibagrus wyckioides]
MTSLAHQLKRLALPQSDPSLLNRREVASVLFDPKDAASMDRSTIYALGCTGLDELLGIEPAFAEFQETLFSQASISLERSVQSKEVNQKLDKDISQFLVRLSPYFLLKPALKCLEWLVHRFHIHLYNQDSLIACVLPYHETKVFVRVIQLLQIEDPTHRWHWLHVLQKPGVPLARGTLLTHCYKDLGFMDFICTLVTKSVEAYSQFAHDGKCGQLRVIFSFYSATIVPALEAVEKVTDSIIAKLLPYIQLGLKSELMDYKAATYMIVCQLAVKVVMQPKLLDSLAWQVSRSVSRAPVLTSEGLSCLIILLQNQKECVIGQKTFEYLCQVPSLEPTLQCIAAFYDISPLLHYLLPKLTKLVIMQNDDLGNEDLQSASNCRLLESLIENLPFTTNLANTVARLLLEGYVSCGTKLPSDRLFSLNQKIQPAVRLIEHKYPGALDAVLVSCVGEMCSAQQKNLLHQFLSLTMCCGKHQVLANSDTSLMLSLKHPVSAVRNMAMEYVKEILTSGQGGFDETFLKDALLERLKDDVPDVVLSALSALRLYLNHMNSEETISCLISLLHRVQPSDTEAWYSVLKEAVQVLDDLPIRETNPDLRAQISWELLPFLLITNSVPESAELKMAQCVADTHLLSQYPLTQGWTKVLRGVLEKTPPADVIRVANQMLISTLTKNLARMEPSTKRSAIEGVCALLAKQSAGQRERAAFVVLICALLQTLESLNESTHLHTAQILLRLLEPSLRKLYALQTDKLYEGEDKVFLPIYEMLADFLLKLHTGQNTEREYWSLLLSLLQHFINSLGCPESTFKGQLWWNPEKLDMNTCCYLQLLCSLFDMVVSGASQGPLLSSFRALLQPLLQVHLSEPEHLFKFLSLLWGYNNNLSDQLEFRVTAVLQTQALYVGKVMLTALPVKKLSILASPSSSVVPSLLGCLSCGVREVRRAAVAVLQPLAGVTSSPYHPLLEKLLLSAEELIADPAYLTQALSRLYEEAVSVTGKGRNKLLLAIEQLLQCVRSPDCPSYIAKVLLRALQGVNGELVLAILLPAMERLLEQCAPDNPVFLPDEALFLQLLLGKYNEASAPLLARDARSLELFITALGTSFKPYSHMDSFQIIAMEQITKSFFVTLGDENIQQRVLGVLFDLLVDNKNPTCSQTINSVFKAIVVDAELVANELTPMDKPKMSGSVQQTRRSKVQPKKAQDTPSEGGTVSWLRVTFILELLQHKKKLKRPQMLVPALFSLLSRCLEVSSELDNMEYTKQLLLSVLLNVCQKLSPQGGPISKDILDEDKFNVELVVQCVRTSNTPQTHHHALLLLGTVAGIFPEKVLHNIMPIFTFMGANIMRLDDTYSFQIINRTVQMVIPALIRAHEGGTHQEGQMQAVVTRIMHTFVDALPHVPEHRRIPILRQLLATLGPSNFLWVLMLLLFKQHATNTALSSTGAEKETALERDQEFWVLLCCEFEVHEQLTSLIKILQFLLTLPKEKDDVPERRRTRGKVCQEVEESTSDLVFHVEAHSGKELRHFKFLSVSFMGQLLAASSFVGKVADCKDLTESSLQALQQSLLEENLRYIHTVALCVEENSDKPTAKFWRALLTKSYDVLDKVNALLPTDTFIMVVRGLMSNQLPSVRRKAMELLNNRLQQRTRWEEQQVTVLLELIDDLLSIVGRGCGQFSGHEEEEQAVNRQTALYSLKLLCHIFGTHHQKAFLPVLSKTVELVANPKEEKNVMSSALLCVAEVTSTLKALAITQIPRLMPAVLQALKERKDLFSTEVYLLSAVTALQRTAETLPHFISPYLEDIILQQVARLTRVADHLTTCPQLAVRLCSLSSTLATKVPPRVLMPTLARCYNSMVESQQSQLCPLMNILKEHIGHMEKDQLNSHQSELTSFFLSALDFRTKHCQGDLEKTTEIEGCVIDCLLAMVMKLSEVTFRPLFFKLFDWSKTEGVPKDRMLTFCRLADCIADRLKGLFVLFAGQLVKPFSDLFRQLNTAHTGEAFFDSVDEDDVALQKSSLLLQYVLDCLHKIFLYDTQRFLSKERTDALLVPLVDQLENMLGGEQVYQTRVTKHLVPCVAQFSVAIGDDSQWKVLNYQILLKTRHSCSKVRFSALLMLVELASKLKENYMVLLPESIPFLAELMEDECEEVEHQVQKTIQEMESILGESLQSYF